MLRYVDHVIIGVDDLTAAAQSYERLLGFSVNAGGVHPGAGTYNRLMVLDPEYIELIARLPGSALREESPVTPMFRRAPGPIGFALGSDDIDADVEAMRRRGVTVLGPVDGRLERPDGSSRGWRTAAAALDADSLPLPFIIQHDSAGAQRLQRIAAPDGAKPHPHPHAIGARRLSHVTVAVRDLDAGLAAYSRVFGLECDVQGDDEMLRARTARLPLQQGAIILAAPVDGDGDGGGPLARGLAAQGEGLFSVAIAVEDLHDAVEQLRSRGVGVRVEKSNGVPVVARPDTVSSHFARLEFVTASAAASPVDVATSPGGSW